MNVLKSIIHHLRIVIELGSKFFFSFKLKVGKTIKIKF
jgi:hypothetical protein